MLIGWMVMMSHSGQMDRQGKGWTYRETNGRTERIEVDRETNGQTQRRTDIHRDERTDIETNRWTERRRVDRWN